MCIYVVMSIHIKVCIYIYIYICIYIYMTQTTRFWIARWDSGATVGGPSNSSFRQWHLAAQHSPGAGPRTQKQFLVLRTSGCQCPVHAVRIQKHRGLPSLGGMHPCKESAYVEPPTNLDSCFMGRAYGATWRVIWSLGPSQPAVLRVPPDNAILLVMLQC